MTNAFFEKLFFSFFVYCTFEIFFFLKRVLKEKYFFGFETLTCLINIYKFGGHNNKCGSKKKQKKKMTGGRGGEGEKFYCLDIVL